VWGASPLVVTDASRAQCELTGACHYRVAPDNLAAVTIRRTQPFQYRGRPLVRAYLMEQRERRAAGHADARLATTNEHDR